jgi:hypothetical protein
MANKGDKVLYYYTNGVTPVEGIIIGQREHLVDLSVGEDETFEHGVQLCDNHTDPVGRYCTLDTVAPPEGTPAPAPTEPAAAESTAVADQSATEAAGTQTA